MDRGSLRSIVSISANPLRINYFDKMFVIYVFSSLTSSYSCFHRDGVGGVDVDCEHYSVDPIYHLPLLSCCLRSIHIKYNIITFQTSIILNNGKYSWLQLTMYMHIQTSYLRDNKTQIRSLLVIELCPIS